MSTDYISHSAEYFGEQRDYWWNRDYLDLMARRWNLSEATSLADIGCGLAHWSRLLFRYLKPQARLVGVDFEPEWVAQAFSQFKREYPNITPEQVKFLQADANRLPLSDNYFDVVTCQTLLMHLDTPEVAFSEMVRITKPGGLVICVEPNNLFNTVYFSSLTEKQSVAQIVRSFEFWLRYQQGKIARGQGNNSIGDLLPGFFASAGLTDTQVYMSDRAAPIFPPYNTPEQKVLLEQENAWSESNTGPWNYKDLHENVLAGGGSEEFFEHAWKDLQHMYAEEQQAIRSGSFFTAGGGMNYLVSGRKARP